MLKIPNIPLVSYLLPILFHSSTQSSFNPKTSQNLTNPSALTNPLSCKETPCSGIAECKFNKSIQGYRCRCPPGYTGLPKCLSDFDECKNDKHTCSKNSNCVNTFGGFSCDCEGGYKPVDSKSEICKDRDECYETNNLCQHKCINKEGSYECACHEGYVMNEETNFCEDYDECENEDHNCEQECINTNGGFYCKCSDGFRRDRYNSNQCYDIDECTEKPPCNLADENQICVNTPGNYECKCPPGYELNFEDRLCENVNECKLKDFDRCGENEHCIDIVGSYQCVCDEGFKFNKVLSSCEDINECDFEYSDVDPDLVMPTCDKRTSHCRNSPGSFYCKCKRGFKNLGDSDKLCTLDFGYFLQNCEEKCMEGFCRLSSENTLLSVSRAFRNQRDNPYECSCTSPFYSGKNCDRCKCKNSGACHPVYERCECKTGFYGEFCEHKSFEMEEHGVKMVTIENGENTGEQKSTVGDFGFSRNKNCEENSKEGCSEGDRLELGRWIPSSFDEIRECCIDEMRQECILWLLVLFAGILVMVLCVRCSVVKCRRLRCKKSSGGNVDPDLTMYKYGGQMNYTVGLN